MRRRLLSGVLIFIMLFLLLANSASAATLLKVGSRGEDVRTLQQKLIELGYLKGKADGIYGPLTRDAVIRFQKAKGLAADGIAGPQTLNALYGTNPPSNKNGQNQSTQPSNSIPTRLLKLGSRGEDVRQLQKRLNELGFSCGAADGIFGNATRAAVIAFQRANGLTADGIAGPATLGKLFADVPPADQKPPAQNPPAENPPSSGSPGTKLPITQILRRGSRGEDVKILQNRLNELGYSVGAADGIFGARTESAVIAFQRANGLAADGIVGPATLAKLFANVPPADQKPPAQNPPAENPPSSGSPGTKLPITQILRRGSRGEDVKILQNRLNELGYSVGAVDGIFGARTESAVIAFQRDHGLVPDGIVGPKTIAKLYEQAPPTDKPKPVDPPKEDEKDEDDFEEFHGIPGQLKGKTIILDPGHGGSDVGATRDGVYEKDLNLDMAKRLKRMLEEAGATVIMTRTTDQYYSLYYRTALANKHILETEINKKLQEKEALEKEYEEKEQRKQEKEAEILEKLARIEEIRGLLEEKKATGAQLGNKSDSLLNKKQQLEQDYNMKKSQHLQKLVKQQQLLQELNNLKDRLHSLEENKQWIEQEIQNLTSQRNELGAQAEAVAEVESQLAALEAELAQINHEIDVVENDILSNQQRLDLLNEEIKEAEMQEQMALEALEELKAYESELDSVKEDIDSLEEELSALLSDVSRLEAEISELEQELEQLALDIANLEEEIEDLKNKSKQFDVYLNNPSLNSRTGIYKANYDAANNKNHINEELKEVFELTRNNYEDDVIFIAIHCNSTASETTTASGVQVYYRASSGPYGINSEYYKGYNDEKRIQLAQSLLKHTTENAGFSGSYSTPYTRDFAVLRETNLVSVLMEIGFINNPKDREHLLKQQTRENVAKGMYLGIVEYFGR